jgi:hypothetical protein
LTRLLLAVTLLSFAGCASGAWSPRERPAAKLLAQADRLVVEDKHAEALGVYDQILARYPDADEAPRARASRKTLAGLLAARAQVVRLTTAGKTHEAELARARGELARARQEILRLTEETDRLRADLEQLKRIDIDLERRQK